MGKSKRHAKLKLSVGLNARKQKLMELINKHDYHLDLIGDPDSGYNLLRLASFVNVEKPSSYDVFRVNENKTVVFWSK